MNRYRAYLSAIFAEAVRLGIVRENPVSRVKRQKENEKRTRYMYPWEEDLFRAKMRELDPFFEAEFDLEIWTGMRRGELFTLKWENVDLKNKRAIAIGKKGPRPVRLGPEARRALGELEKRRTGSPFVCAETKAEKQIDWRRRFERIRDAAGIKNLHFHDLRHTYLSRAAMRGATAKELAELAGHTSIATTDRYMHLSEDHVAAAAEKFGAKE